MSIHEIETALILITITAVLISTAVTTIIRGIIDLKLEKEYDALEDSRVIIVKRRR